jgi:hypothetical protein
MSDKINTNGKMKKVGYICLGFAAICTIIRLLGALGSSSDQLIYYWGGLGVTLLFGNSAKHAIGSNLQNKKKEL